MAIGGCTLQAGIRQAEVHACEQLLGLVAAAGEEGGPQALHQGIGRQPDRLAALHQGQIGEVFSGHGPHLVGAGQAGEFHLFSPFGALQGDRGIRRQPGHDLSEQAGGQGDGAAGLHIGRDAGLDAEAEVEAGEAEPAGAGIGREQHVGEHRMGGTGGHGPANQLEAGAEFRLGADQLHGGCSRAWRGPNGPPRFHRAGHCATPVVRLRSTSTNERIEFKRKQVIQ